MPRTRLRSAAVLAGLAAALGCQGAAPTPTGKMTPATGRDERKSASGLDELSPADREVAAAQKTCPVSGHPLGSMGAPVKVTLNGKPVFVCCDGCVSAASAHPDETVKKAEASKGGK